MTLMITPPQKETRHPEAFRLMNADGTPMVRAADSVYTAASQDGKLAFWNPRKGSADSDLLPEKDIIDGRARDLTRNDVSAKAGIDTLLDLIIGTGPTLVPIPDYKSLGLDKEWAAEWARDVQGKWHDYADSTDIDASGWGNLADNLRLGTRTEFVQGEQTIVPVYLPDRPGCDYGTCFSWVDPDRLSTPNFQPDSQYLRSGVEIDEWGAAIAYHVAKVHPADVGFFAAIEGAFEWERIDAFNEWGRPKFIHAYERERADQHRGLSLLASMLPLYKDSSDYRSSEMKAALANSLIAAVTESTMSMEQLMGLFDNDGSELLKKRAEYVLNLKPGTILPLFPGEKLASHNPGRPNAAYADFMRANDRMISLGYKLPYEIGFKDFSVGSYSSIKAALVSAKKSLAPRQGNLKSRVIDKLYACWLEEAVGNGWVEAPGFEVSSRNRRLWSRNRIIWDGDGWLDPAREAQAAQLRIALGISTYEIECANQGNDWREVMEQRSVEQRFMRVLELDQAQLTTSIALAPQNEQHPS